MEIEKRLKKILLNRIKINNNLLKEHNDEPLTGPIFKFSPIDMVYLYYFVREEFGDCINRKDLFEGKFNSINQIVHCIESNLLSKS